MASWLLEVCRLTWCWGEHRMASWLLEVCRLAWGWGEPCMEQQLAWGEGACMLAWWAWGECRLASWWLEACRLGRLCWERRTQGWAGPRRRGRAGAGRGCRQRSCWPPGTAAWQAGARCSCLIPGAGAWAGPQPWASCKLSQGWG